MAKILQPGYRLVKRDGPFEIRAYEPMILAEVQLAGGRRDAMGKGFKILSDYINRANEPGVRLPMTVPVTLQPAGDKINGKSWIIRFIMPPGSVLDKLPKPNDGRIVLFPVPVARAAICRFAGRAGNDTLKDRTAALKNWVNGEGLSAAAPPTYAFYNGPLTLPFLRRNEVMVAVEY